MVTDSLPITRFIGEAERTLQALLQRQLEKSEITFAQWVAMTSLSGGPLISEQLMDSIAGARIVAAGKEMNVFDGLVEKGLAERGTKLSLTSHGREMFQSLRAGVLDIVSTLIFDIPNEDLATTRRVLEVVTNRAARLLSE